MTVVLRGMPGLHPTDADRHALECVLWRDQQDQCRDALVAEGALLVRSERTASRAARRSGLFS